jgi:hypothetical protein
MTDFEDTLIRDWSQRSDGSSVILSFLLRKWACRSRVRSRSPLRRYRWRPVSNGAPHRPHGKNAARSGREEVTGNWAISPIRV